jgi:hypothetical protein
MCSIISIGEGIIMAGGDEGDIRVYEFNLSEGILNLVK